MTPLTPQETEEQRELNKSLREWIASHPQQNKEAILAALTQALAWHIAQHSETPKHCQDGIDMVLKVFIPSVQSYFRRKHVH